MRFKKVLLANLIAHERSFLSQRAVLRAGMGYIAQSLKNAGINYSVMDMALGYSVIEFIRKIKDFNPDLIAVTLFTYKYLRAYSIINNVKKRFPTLKIVCGGPHVTTFLEKVLEECPAIDYLITFEGEKPIADLCNGRDLKEIQGLIYRKNGNIVSNLPANFIENLDSIPFPQYQGFELENYPIKKSPVEERIIPIVSSRGCPYNCIYCTVQTIMGKKFRARSIDNVISEIEYWYEKGYRKFSFVDDNFTLVQNRVLEFCRKIREKNLNGLYFLLHNGIRADKMPVDILKEMKLVGFEEIGIGIEASDNRILRLLNKSENIETMEKAIKNACEQGFAVDLYFLIGSPGETLRDSFRSAEIAVKYPINNAFFFNLIPYPETLLFKWVKENGKFLYQPRYYLNKINSSMNRPVFETSNFTADERRKALIETKKIFRNFKRKQYFKKLRAKNIPFFLAFVASYVYSIRVVQILFNDIRFLRFLRKKIWQGNFSQ